MKKVMVFGVFDGVHEGHRAFLRAAKAHGDHLIAVVAQDHIVHNLKGHTPKYALAERVGKLLEEALADEVVPGDDIMGVYSVIKTHRPHIIALGYDQQALRNDILNRESEFDWEWEIKMMEPHEPDKFHSRLLH